MLSKLSLLVAASAASRVFSEDVCLANCVIDGDTGKEVCTFTTKINLYAGELGYYQFEECGDATNPTLGLEVGKTYEFVQKDPSN